MVLDNYDINRDVLIFKNTYDDPTNGLTKKFEIERTDPHAPKELYFVHIEIKDMQNLPSENERIANRKEEKEMRKKTYESAINRDKKRSAESSSRSENTKTAKFDDK